MGYPPASVERIPATTKPEKLAMTDERADETPKCPECETPVDHKDRIRGIAARLRNAAIALGGEAVIDIPDRLGDHKGLMLALANELERLVG
jgi:hypothetical protein